MKPTDPIDCISLLPVLIVVQWVFPIFNYAITYWQSTPIHPFLWLVISDQITSEKFCSAARIIHLASVDGPVKVEFITLNHIYDVTEFQWAVMSFC